MSLHITNLNSVTVAVKPKNVYRTFTISPAWSGSSTINIDDGAMNIGSYGTYTITPTTTFTASVKLWGAGGGGVAPVGSGAGGGFSHGTVRFVEGVQYIIVVGQGGSVVSGSTGPRTHGGGGYGRNTGLTVNPRGGGLSGIFSGSYLQGNSIIVAGGGGGGRFSNQVRQGAGGGLTGQNGYTTGASLNSVGATTASAGYWYGNVGKADGGPLIGGIGPSSSYSAPGGGGYFGGGGADSMGSGGSGYISPTITGSSFSGSYLYPANYTDPDNGGSGYPGIQNVSGTNGRVIIY